MIEPVVMNLQCGRFELTLERPLLMGILNVTPDSFSDGGRYHAVDDAIARGQRMREEGADIIDIGGESTRPGAVPVSADEEIARVTPVVEALRGLGIPLSVDTRAPAVMRAVLAAGADMINDVQGFGATGAVDAVRGSRAALCVMHMLGNPSTMQQAPVYRDVVSEVVDWLYRRRQWLIEGGVETDRIVLDPGIGFGKTQPDNLRLLHDLPRLCAGGAPVLIGVSRKSVIGHLTGRAVHERLAGSLAAMLCAVERGARIVRVHDVAQTRDALRVRDGIEAAVSAETMKGRL